MTALVVPPHAFIRKPRERAHGIDFIICDGCGLPSTDIVHAEAPIAAPDDNEMDPISGLPYHDFQSAFTGGPLGEELPTCTICGFGPASSVHNKPPANTSLPMDTEEMLAAGEYAAMSPKKGKHHYVHARALVSHSFYPYGLCAACGRPAADPDHDGDVDDPNAGTDVDSPQTAAELSARFNQTIWTETAAGSGTMVALFPEASDARKLALGTRNAEEAKDLHVTVAHLPNFDAKNLPELHNVVGHFASRTPPISGRVSGKGEFAPTPSSDNKHVTYASIDAPGLAQHHTELTNAIQDRGIPVSKDHGFTPHMTLKYGKHDGKIGEHPLTFSHITVAHGDQRIHFPLSGMWSPYANSDDGAEAAREHLQITDRTPATDTAPPAPVERAFVTEVNGKTLLTAPAYMVPESFEKARNPNNFMKYMAGRFVGGEQANRNGAFWSTGDLEFGVPTVAHGPLNWLHEAKHIIGSITAAELVSPTSEQAADGVVPHIQAMSGIWAWIYPQEAQVIEQASDQGKLWYSMECVSNDVECVGAAGCGAKVGYLDYLRNAAGTCQHMKQRAGAERRFAEPTFLGGAVIVPPVRPGWADAHAAVMKQAASLAEKAFEQAGKPDIEANVWEQLMAEVLTFAGVE